MFAATATSLDRINVRLGGVALKQLEELVAQKGASVSEIVRESLAEHYASFKRGAGRPKKSAIVAAVGKFRSSGEGTGTLSVDYKRVLDSGLSEKHRRVGK